MQHPVIDQLELQFLEIVDAILYDNYQIISNMALCIEKKETAADSLNVISFRLASINTLTSKVTIKESVNSQYRISNLFGCLFALKGTDFTVLNSITTPTKKLNIKVIRYSSAEQKNSSEGGTAIQQSFLIQNLDILRVQLIDINDGGFGYIIGHCQSCTLNANSESGSGKHVLSLSTSLIGGKK